jgi:hypothetical protein
MCLQTTTTTKGRINGGGVIEIGGDDEVSTTLASGIRGYTGWGRSNVVVMNSTLSSISGQTQISVISSPIIEWSIIDVVGIQNDVIIKVGALYISIPSLLTSSLLISSTL